MVKVMWFPICLFVCVLSTSSCGKVIFDITYPSKNNTATCTTPFGIPGECIEILECPELVAKLHEGANGLRLVHQSKCGHSHERTKVCCLQPQTTLGPVTPTPVTPTNVSEPILPKDCGFSFRFRVTGGEEAELGAWPWAALLYIEGTSGGSWSCGGSLISKRYVLTAAHCVHSSTIGNRLVTKVRLGEHDLDTNTDRRTISGKVISADPPQEFVIEEIIAHPQFEFTGLTLLNDVALIRLAEPANITEWVYPVCLPSLSDTPPLPDERAFVIGWGNLGAFQGGSSTLQQLQVPIVETQKCADAYNNQLGTRIPLEEQQHLCAGGEHGKDSCKGDSGGALQKPNAEGIFTQIGIVSFGYKYCGQSGIPGVYANLATFMPWIEENLRR